MPKYPLKKKDAAFLTLEIDGAEYNIPLVSSMKVKEARGLLKLASANMNEAESVDYLMDFLARYMGEEIVDEMLFSDMLEVFHLWMKANDEVGGLSLGE